MTGNYYLKHLKNGLYLSKQPTIPFPALLRRNHQSEWLMGQHSATSFSFSSTITKKGKI